jgi:hypothetical protein
MEFPLVKAISQNPFYVLGVGAESSRQDIEREGQKLLSMLALDIAESRTYATPLGDQPRTPELVRSSMAELRNPSRRLLHEILATLPSSLISPEEDERWRKAPSAFGYGPDRDRET